MILKDVKALLDGKSSVTVEASDTVKDVAEKMAAKNERAASVISNGTLVGIISDKDIVHKCVAKGLDVTSTAVCDVMTGDPVTIDANENVTHAIDKMLQSNFHHLPVIDAGKLTGMIYSDDIPEEYRLLLEHYKELKG